MGYLDDEIEEYLEEEEEDFEGEEEIRELEVDDNGRIRRGPVVNPDESYFEEQDGLEQEDEDLAYPED